MTMISFVRHKEILGELYLPNAADNNHIRIVWLPGLPNQPSTEDMGKPLSEMGFTVLQVRYPGSWQSYGEFGPSSSYESAILGMELLISGHTLNLNTNEEIIWNIEHTVLIGNSYGGGIAIAALACSELADAAISFCPLIEPEMQNSVPTMPEDDLTTLYPYLKRCHENVFRHLKKEEWNAYINGRHPLTPVKFLHKLKYKNLLLIHGTSDTSIRHFHTVNFYQKLHIIGASKTTFISEPEVGHGKALRQATKNKWVNWLLKQKQSD
ncbi:alpha/beta hydrolase family protein [Thalassobacillus pellis]|uniref:alpha/beta hydrolase family protein n=1 Tax=Thalassobacillus pellis TaxID=748008 RepID=UPI001960CB23|nr:prolyl oligopeptidase family serine peptidase [Thalassobacillus pellis]MBM7553569.1 putative esterase [Thalassobacillus pellis]